MVWYKKYLTVYETPYSAVHEQVAEEVKAKLGKLGNSDPLVSVIAIAHNEAPHILACLWSLCDNLTDFPIEILVVNNHSTDATTEILEKTGVTWFDEPQKGPGFARQCGLNRARGKYHLCIDADTLYPKLYIRTMVRKLMKKDTVAVYGLWSFIPDKQHPKTGLFFYELLRDIHLKIQNIKRPELCVRGMVFGFDTEAAKKYGFRTDILRGEDGSLALQLKKEGKIKFVTSRKVRVFTGNGTLNTEGSLLNNLKSRALKAFHKSNYLFTKQDAYQDDDSNLIK
ncbi:MAG: glycosyltransferase family 2 protein [Parabacteroides sp.]|nr:glycosyltransferase family 2 protein [Parabacteroides sp.]